MNAPDVGRDGVVTLQLNPDQLEWVLRHLTLGLFDDCDPTGVVRYLERTWVELDVDNNRGTSTSGSVGVDS